MLAEVGEDPLRGVAVPRSVLGEPVLRTKGDVAVVEERDVEQLVVALDGSDITSFELGGALDALHLFGLIRRSSRFHLLPELLSVLRSERWRRVQENECTNALRSRRGIERDHVRRQ